MPSGDDQRTACFDRLSDDCNQVQSLLLKAELALANAGHVEQILHEPQGVVRLARSITSPALST